MCITILQNRPCREYATHHKQIALAVNQLIRQCDRTYLGGLECKQCRMYFTRHQQIALTANQAHTAFRENMGGFERKQCNMRVTHHEQIALVVYQLTGCVSLHHLSHGVILDAAGQSYNSRSLLSLSSSFLIIPARYQEYQSRRCATHQLFYVVIIVKSSPTPVPQHNFCGDDMYMYSFRFKTTITKTNQANSAMF